MKNYLKLKLLWLFLLFFSFVQGQTALDKLKYEAYIQRDFSKWMKAVSLAEKADLSKTENAIELIHCYYAVSSNLIARKMRDEAEKHITKGQALTDKVLKKEPDNALALNYKGCFLGYEIALNKLKALKIGKSATTNIDRALRLEPNNPQILFDKGNSLYFPPKIFGGDKAEALKLYQKAIAILEKQNKTQNNWIYIQLLVVEGHSYELAGDEKSAEKSYLKILKLAPDFQTVKNDLYPKLKSRMNENTR